VTAEIAPGPDVTAGSILAYRLFDVAYAIDLAKAEETWARTVRTESSRGRLVNTPPKAIAFGVPPVSLGLGTITLSLPEGPMQAAVTARLYDFGVISMALRLPVADLSWAAFSRRLNAVDRAVGLVPAGGVWTELLRHRYSFYTDDMVVLTWDRAFIYEPRGDTDVIDVLEVANAQLLEMRYYDELLDAELPRMYDLVEATRRRWMLPGARRFADLARRLYTLVAEVTELTEKVDNALQVTEDVYLARIYAAALELFRVPTVSAAVDRKLSIIRDTYSALYDEAHSSRSEVLEIFVLVLIAVEIVLAIVR
jgi:hypothetical protein